MTARFTLNTCIYWGKKVNHAVTEVIKARDLRNVLFIIDHNLVDLPPTNALLNTYRTAGLVVASVPYAADCEPTYNGLDAFVAILRNHPAQVIIGVGGGSVLDVAKGAGILLRNPGKALEYRGMDKVPRPGIPVVCYPTTAGTGSEVTHTASFIDSESLTKLGINGRHVAPWFGVLMPELSFSCPRGVTIAAALDAMVHASEAVSARTSNALTVALAVPAFAAMYTWLPVALNDPHDYAAREALLLGSYAAGMAMMNAGGSPVSGISYPLGVHYGVPHGLAGGIIMRHAFAMNVAKGYTGYARLYEGLPDADHSLTTDTAKAKAFVRQFSAWYERIGAPANLNGWNVRSADISRLTELSMTQRKGNLDLNPVPFEEADVRDLLHRVVES